jgi:hypothetical protein
VVEFFDTCRADRRLVVTSNGDFAVVRFRYLNAGKL